MIVDLVKAIFGAGGGRNLIKDTAEVFMVNKEAEAARQAVYSTAALEQFAAEFSQPRQNRFDSFIDGLNRIPRPLMAFGIIGLFVSAMTSPSWFAVTMTGLAAVPEPLWWLLGVIVTFYFGGRHQAKAQSFDLKKQVAALPAILESQRTIQALVEEPEIPKVSEMDEGEFQDAMNSTDPLSNEAILEWNRRNN